VKRKTGSAEEQPFRNNRRDDVSWHRPERLDDATSYQTGIQLPQYLKKPAFNTLLPTNFAKEPELKEV